MPGEFTKREALQWIEVMYKPDQRFIQEFTGSWSEHREVLINKIAENLYTDIRRVHHFFSSPYNLNKPYSKLTESEKLPWYDYAGNIPRKLRLLNLHIRPYKDFCRTCLIPYREMETLARADYHAYCHKSEAGSNQEKATVQFRDLVSEEKRFYIELNHLIPVSLKKAGYEMIRSEELSEISDRLTERFARIIHSRYLRETRKKDKDSKRSFYLSWLKEDGSNPGKMPENFDDLPEEIRHSNLDNAYHIPTKLLSIGYKLRQSGKGFKPAVLHLNEDEIETMARVEHIRWCWDKILHGWIYGKIKDETKRTHPAIIPYEDLSESEKEKDRELVKMIPALLQDVDYDVFHVNPEKISKLPYAIRPQSSINRILDETRKLNAQIRDLVAPSPEVETMIEARNKKIEEALREIESSYNYALHIQKSFLPDNLFIRECFPESFVLFKPRDIVSGDFYFFSKRRHNIIFAAADCTGHGIPGALLSTIGFGILDEAVNVLKHTDPVKILEHLYLKMHKFLKMEKETKGVSDDLDIALCSLDTESSTLTFAGIGNPLYHVSDGKLDEYRPGNLNKKQEENDAGISTSERIRVKHGDSIYLLSDGYADQFGGRFHKRYQTSKLKNLLVSINDKPMPEQGDLLYEELEKWREEVNEQQTDDILVIGIRI